MPLPPIEPIQITVEEDLSPGPPSGFLRLRRARLRLRYGDGRRSASFVYDTIERKALDAVVVAAHFRDDRGQRCVYLRTAVRPPLHLRPLESRPFPEPPTLGVLWELPAGLVEPDECSLAGLRECASRELGEELGFTLPADRFEPLGPSAFPLPGAIGERHHYFHVEVSPAEQRTPSEDGSVLEQRAAIAAVPLREALQLASEGALEDAKTELALRRLADALVG
ncbi:MAG: NUDIX hydrolase [Deltaproteobacteria bacterium]|nr:NUDIX hydrolase [Deltaproteobacteria bacterium]MBW2530814.1 NUDIX hydrolase [Deltaproteobacteria bacterium]